MIRTVVWLRSLVALAVAGAAVSRAAADAEPGHKAAHGGCLNALGTCENGHAEVRVDGARLELWFVGGGTDTQRAVRIPDPQIALTVTLPGAPEPRVVVLTATPNELAEEKTGDCSHFAGEAEWLRTARTFTAQGKVTFRGRPQDLRIEYPGGYDPDEETGGEPLKAAAPGGQGAKAAEPAR